MLALCLGHQSRPNLGPVITLTSKVHTIMRPLERCTRSIKGFLFSVLSQWQTFKYGVSNISCLITGCCHNAYLLAQQKPKFQLTHPHFQLTYHPWLLQRICLCGWIYDFEELKSHRSCEIGGERPEAASK